MSIVAPFLLNSFYAGFGSARKCMTIFCLCPVTKNGLVQNKVSKVDSGDSGCIHCQCEWESDCSLTQSSQYD